MWLYYFVKITFIYYIISFFVKLSMKLIRSKDLSNTLASFLVYTLCNTINRTKNSMDINIITRLLEGEDEDEVIDNWLELTEINISICNKLSNNETIYTFNNKPSKYLPVIKTRDLDYCIEII